MPGQGLPGSSLSRGRERGWGSPGERSVWHLRIVWLGQGLGKVWQSLAACTCLVGRGDLLEGATEKHGKVEQVEQRMSRGREEVMLF